jgi:hypothetical protein
MPWFNIKDVADYSLEKKGIKNQLQESLVINEANKLIVEFFAEDAKDKARAIYFSSGVLTIAVLSDDLHGQMKSQEEEFVAILNSKFLDNIISSLKFLN